MCKCSLKDEGIKPNQEVYMKQTCAYVLVRGLHGPGRAEPSGLGCAGPGLGPD